jgi:hypothetical protein
LIIRISQNFSPKDHCYTFIFFIANDILNYDVNLPLYIEITITTSMVEFKPYQLCTSGKFMEVTINSGNGVEEEKANSD